MRLMTTLLVLLSTLPLYSQTAPPVRKMTKVESVTLTDDSIVSSQHFQQAVRYIQDKSYSSNPEKRITEAAQSAMGDQGYFKSEVATVATEVLNETTRTRTISVTLRIREGEQYHVSRITFAHQGSFPEAQLRQAFPIQDGDVMSDKKIREGLENVRAILASKGYMEGGAVPQVVADDATHTVSIIMEVNEGPQFTVNGLTLEEGSQYSVDGVVPKVEGRWTADQSAKLQALARSYVGTHQVQGFVDAVKKELAQMFPDYDQIDSLIGHTQGTAKNIITVNVHYPEKIPF